MGMELRVLMVMAMVIGFISAASAASGTATYYERPYVPSACYGNQNDGVMIAGASDTIWNNRAACGRSYTVTCTGAANDTPNPCKGGSITVKIVDYCANCNGDINLSQDAFAKIADLEAGKIKVEYKQV
ncbi:EG45-like domain containing protein [Macadamia integrifolia]|uniref:EG45-like domain containing protein n=1 Tax=Macadamia integrifolia TaxID=60698 RepID=UPI001C4FB49F|nr:EG45-like domain containing protein [Macadamia integrifolia]